MIKIKFTFALLILAIMVFVSCKKTETNNNQDNISTVLSQFFGTNINLNQLENYSNQSKPTYINKDNTGANAIDNKKATLGRVLFYDKNLSIDNSISCSSCHQQQFAFSDTSVASKGVSGGTTGRHSMRLINARFANEAKFFWDERAATLEAQTTRPIQDHAEMGFSGQSGRPDINTLITKLKAINYYNELFNFAYGNTDITEVKLQECLSQFIRSIQSFDSKFDAGRAQVNADNVNFPNFTNQENMGKGLFLAPPVFDANGNRTAGGLGCGGCHGAPEFDIDPNTRNNGIIGTISGSGIDITNTRAPSLRDLVNVNGEPNGPMMHTGAIKTLQAAIGHYGTIVIAPGNTNLDPRLTPGGVGQKLQLTAPEVNAVIAFLKTLSGTNVYIDKKWSNPFLK
jgi:cytochrome c peroxidase